LFAVINQAKASNMNKLNKIIGAALLSISMNSFAGDCPALSGKFTIGKSETADFSTVTDAMNALKCGGVSGPVTFRLETGTYDERVVVSAIPGASVMNNITFESKTGNNSDVTIVYGNTDATMVMNGASYVTFQNITIDHQAAVYGNTLRVDGKASNIRFKSVVFNGVEVARTGANSATVYFSSAAPKTDIAFEDCEINNGSSGIYKSGMSSDARDTRTTITGTLFFNQYETALALSNENAPVITNNVVSSLSSYNDFKGINLDNVSNNMIVSNNIITIANGSAGLGLNNCMATVTRFGQISNNSIAIGGKGTACGILVSGNTDNQVLNFNRVKLANTTNQAYYRNNGSGNNINMMNEIMYDLNKGGYTIIGNTYKDVFNQLPAQSNSALTASANGIMIEKAFPVK
jgi:hypothetical protein